ncbi:MFS transporter [Nonomuraea sp. NPDC052116]|uniref:MFS transporter n=1 Tax=Nonomuraea sp. NPDC052116 TaxID=3155665 RepID=UPI0034402BF8
MSNSAGTSSTTTNRSNRSYRDVLRDKRVAGLLLGDLLANISTGMILVAMPVQTLRIHGDIPPAIAVGMVEAAPFVLSTILALGIGLGRVRTPPRTLLLADCVLRALTFTGLGLAAVTDRLSLPVLVSGLLLGAAFRMAGASGRRLLVTSMASESERYGVNGLLGLNSNVALYVLGPVAGGLMVAADGPGAVLFVDACGALLLMACVLRWAPRAGSEPQSRPRSEPPSRSKPKSKPRPEPQSKSERSESPPLGSERSEPRSESQSRSRPQPKPWRESQSESQSRLESPPEPRSEAEPWSEQSEPDRSERGRSEPDRSEPQSEPQSRSEPWPESESPPESRLESPSEESTHARQDESGWRVLRRRPVAARLLVVVFFFNFLYMPVEVALPLYVQGTLHSGASGLGLLWSALGVGAIAGAALVNLMRGLPQRHLLITIIGLWALCPIALAAADNLTAAMIVFALGGLVWAPFTPVAYSFLQSDLRPSEQQPVVTLWTTGSTIAAPLGLVAGGPLIQLTGTDTGLVVSGLLTLLLVPLAAATVLTRGQTAVETSRRAPGTTTHQ